uniref:Uncharacterized protein n=1 Tax=Anopheles culicifacies TaxID=139723 RepID=A0A182M914_9DIPT
MFRRFSLFDAAPPSSTVSVSRPKPPPVPKLQHSNSSSCATPASATPVPEFRVPPRTDPINIAGSGAGDSTSNALAINGNRTPHHLLREGSSTSELNHLHQTPPGHSPSSVGSVSSTTAVAPPPVAGGIKLLSSSPAYHRHSSIGGSAPANTASVLQQQLFASIYNQGPNRQTVHNVPVVQAAATTNGHVRSGAGVARERYSSGRSISSPVSPNQFGDCPLSTSMPTSIKYYYTSPTWYSRFSHSLRKNVLRRSTSAHNSPNVMSYNTLPVADPFLEKVPLSDLASDLQNVRQWRFIGHLSWVLSFLCSQPNYLTLRSHSRSSPDLRNTSNVPKRTTLNVCNFGPHEPFSVKIGQDRGKIHPSRPSGRAVGSIAQNAFRSKPEDCLRMLLWITLVGCPGAKHR